MSLIKYRVFCLEEQIWTEGWLPQQQNNVIRCFNDIAHQVNNDSVQQTEVTQIITVKIEEESIKTGGQYSVDGFSIKALPNTDSSMTVKWPLAVSVMIVNIQVDENHKGDVLNSIINPNTICGVVTSNFEIGGKKISVSSTVVKNVKVGWEIIIGTEFLGRVIEIDLDNFFITLEKSTSVYHQIGSPVFTQVRPIRNLHLCSLSGLISLGASNIGGKYIKAGTPTKIIYTNNSDFTKTFNFNIEYLF